jgi:hypothetical protein
MTNKKYYFYKIMSSNGYESCNHELILKSKKPLSDEYLEERYKEFVWENEAGGYWEIDDHDFYDELVESDDN